MAVGGESSLVGRAALHRGRAAVVFAAAVALACCLAYPYVLWVLRAGNGKEVELVGGANGAQDNAQCGRLCQARKVILKAKAALDRRANMEINILQGHKVSLVQRQTARVTGKAAIPNRGLELSLKSSNQREPAKATEQQLVQMPAASSNRAPKRVRPAPTPQLQRHLSASTKPNPEHAKHKSVQSHAHKAVQAHQHHQQALLDGKPVTKADLQSFVRRTISKERQVLEGTAQHASKPAAAKKTQLAEHYSYYDTHNLHWFCNDNANWRGPFGDPCVSYAVGGDRQFWCEWDGASAGNACPRACGTCSHAALQADHRLRKEQSHMLKDHFDPLEAPSSDGEGDISGVPDVFKPSQASQQKLHAAGPTEPKAVVEERQDNSALLKEIGEMKKKLMGVERATEGVQKELHLSREDNKRFSTRQAANDLNRFYEGRPSDSDSTEAVKGDFGDKLKRAHSGAWATKDMMEWFDKHDEVLTKSQAQQEKEDEEAQERRMSDLGAAKDIQHYWEHEKAAAHASKKAEVRAAAARKLSDKTARSRLASYWSDEQKRVDKLNGGKKPPPDRPAGLTQYSDEAARKDLTDYLSQMVKGAQQDHDKTVAAARERREERGAGQAAVESKGMTAAQAADALDNFWKHQPSEAVHVWWGKKPDVGSSSEGAKDDSGNGGREAAFITAKSKGAAGRAQAEAAHEEESAEEEKAREEARLYREHSDGEYSAKDLGLPTGRTAAVDVPQGKRGAARADAELSSYFADMEHNARKEDDRRHGRLGWKKDAMREAAERQQRKQQLILGYERAHGVPDSPYGYAAASPYPTPYAAASQPVAGPPGVGSEEAAPFSSAYQSFMQQVNTQASRGTPPMSQQANLYRESPPPAAAGGGERAAFITSKSADTHLGPAPRMGPDGEGWGGGKWIRGIGASSVAEAAAEGNAAAAPMPTGAE